MAGLQKKVDEVKGIMVDNIEQVNTHVRHRSGNTNIPSRSATLTSCNASLQVLARGERIENLVDKTDNLRFQADRFHKTGVAIRRKMWWQHKKMILVVILIILILALVIFLSVCFSVSALPQMHSSAGCALTLSFALQVVSQSTH